MPGRKAYVLDCQWLPQLQTYGLLSGVFRPDSEIRRLRSYLRDRDRRNGAGPTVEMLDHAVVGFDLGNHNPKGG